MYIYMYVWSWAEAPLKNNTYLFGQIIRRAIAYTLTHFCQTVISAITYMYFFVKRAVVVANISRKVVQTYPIYIP